MVIIKWHKPSEIPGLLGRALLGGNIIGLVRDRDLKRLMNTVIHECVHARDVNGTIGEKQTRMIAKAAADALWSMGYRPTRSKPWKK